MGDALRSRRFSDANQGALLCVATLAEGRHRFHLETSCLLSMSKPRLSLEARHKSASWLVMQPQKSVNSRGFDTAFQWRPSRRPYSPRLTLHCAEPQHPCCTCSARVCPHVFAQRHGRVPAGSTGIRVLHVHISGKPYVHRSGNPIVRDRAASTRLWNTSPTAFTARQSAAYVPNVGSRPAHAGAFLFPVVDGCGDILEAVVFSRHMELQCSILSIL